MQLVRYDAARNALAEAHRIDEVKDIRDKAEAMAAYARQAKDKDLIQWATEIKVRAERKAGVMLADAAERGERATPNGNVNPATKVSHRSTPIPTLSDLGISRDQSSRWQKLAGMSDDHFEAAVETAKAVAGEVTTAFMLRQATPKQPDIDDGSALVVVPAKPIRSHLDQATEFFGAVEMLAGFSLTGEQIAAALPHFQHYRIDQNIDAAIERLQEIRKQWTKTTKKAA